MLLVKEKGKIFTILEEELKKQELPNPQEEWKSLLLPKLLQQPHQNQSLLLLESKRQMELESKTRNCKAN